jgi:putative CocE/NonD family hydrolase
MKYLPQLLFILICGLTQIQVFAHNGKPEKGEKVSKLGVYKGYSEKAYKGADYSTQYIKMPDGVQLAIDLHLPKGLEEDKQVPTIVYFVRYGRSLQLKKFFRFLANPLFKHVSKEEIDYFTSYGYACLVVDLRGSGASFGHRKMEFSPAEVEDMSSVLDWIVDQKWSDGKTATTGISYTGTTAELALSSKHPSLKACIARCNIFDLYDDMVLPGGLRQAPFVKVWKHSTQALDHNNFKVLGKKAKTFVKGINPVEGDHKRLLAAVKEHQKNFDIFSGLLRIEARDDIDSVANSDIDRFSVHNRIPSIEASNVPIYRISGWYDGGNIGGVIKGFWNVKNTDRVLIGPWDHGPDENISPFSKSRKVKFDVYAEMLRYLDFHLKGIENGIDKENPFHYYQMGTEEFRSTDQWPLATVDMQDFFLNASKELSTEVKEKGSVSYNCDYKIGTGGGARWNSLTPQFRYAPIGYPDREKFADRMLLFESQPLEQLTEITGHPLAELYISADAKDAQLFVYLEDVAPNGEVTYITEGQFRAKHRKVIKNENYKTAGPFHSFRREDMMDLVPEQVTKLEFALLPISYQIPKGHRIRLSVASSDIDHFEVPQERPKTIKIYQGEEQASKIILPIVGQE